MTYEILKGIPVPASGYEARSKRKYPFGEMEIGDSVFIPDWPKDKKGDFIHSSCYSKSYKVGLIGRKTIRDGVEGYMIWRIK